MSTGFEWRFGDDLPEGTSDEGEPQARRWSRWLVWGLVLLIVCGGAYAWWRQRQRTLDEAEAEVQQVARLELRALVEEDMELYMSLQDSAKSAWREAQAVYTETAALPLPIHGLTATQTSVEGARIVGDQAEVEVVHRAILPNGQSASFRAVRFYRYTSDGRWLHTQIEPSAGGGAVVFTGPSIELSVLERDADWVEPLLPQLEDVTDAFCDLVSCRQNLPASFDLAADLAEGAATDDVTLPAPFLVGAPQNEAARQAWEAALQALLVDHLVAREVGRPAEGIAGQLFEDRLSAWFRAKLEVDSGAYADFDALPTTSDTVQRSDSWVPLWELYRLSSDDSRRQLAEAQVDLLLDFLEREYGPLSVAGLVHAFDSADDTRELLGGILNQPWSEFESRYLAYLREVTAERVADLSAFASYDLVLSCWGPADARLELWGLSLNQPAMTLLSAGSESGPLSPIAWSPDGAYLLLRRQAGDEAYFLLQEGSAGPRPFRMLPEGTEYVAWLTLGDDGGWSPDGRYLVYRVSGSSPEDGILNLRTGERVPLGGTFVAWSPDSTRLIYSEPFNWHWTPESDVATFWLQDVESGQAQRLGQGYDAAWSPDGSRIGIVSSAPAVNVHHLDTGGTVELLGTQELRRTLGFTPTLSLAAGRPFRVAWSPGDERVAVGATRFGEDEPEESLTILLETGTHRVLHQQAGGIYDVIWSPDARWLTTFTFGRERFRSVVSDVDGNILFEEEDAFVSWSPEGRHMAVVQGLLPLRVLDIESGEWQAFEVPGECWRVMWNPRAPLDETTMGIRDFVPSSDGRSSVQACHLRHCRP